MKPEDVPADLTEVAYQAYLRAPQIPINDVSVWGYVLAAVLPAHERQVREQVAAEIEARVAEHRATAARLDEGDRADRLEAIGWHATADHLSEGARIARGGSR